VCRLRHGQPRCVCAADCHTLLHGAGVAAATRGRAGAVRRRRSTTLDGGGAAATLAGSWHGPVCAFDGRTHRNLCALAKSNCRSGRELPVDYIGPCQSQFVALNSCFEITRFNLKVYH